MTAQTLDPPVITLTTDFGVKDPFVGIMKGVILGIAPYACIVDLCHEIPPQDILAGALELEAAVPCFPPGTVHVAVVDPGVGSERAAVAIETERFTFVGPDNGLFTAALAREDIIEAVRLTNTAYFRQPVSATFHGRDIFAPVAAHIAAGTPVVKLGEAAPRLIMLDLPQPIEHGDTLEAHVIHVDRFGNLVTDLTAETLARWSAQHGEALHVSLAGAPIGPLCRTFADVDPGRPVAYIGSGGRLEIAIRNGSAAETFQAGRGATVTLEPAGR